MKTEQPKSRTHKEAFCLMEYTCGECKHVFTVWNSRDGVTPFAVSCTECAEGTAQHSNWPKDVFNPGYELKPGDRYFRDGTAEDAVHIIGARLKKWKEIDMLPPEDVQKTLMDNAISQDPGDWTKGWPIMDTWPDPRTAGKRVRVSLSASVIGGLKALMEEWERLFGKYEVESYTAQNHTLSPMSVTLDMTLESFETWDKGSKPKCWQEGTCYVVLSTSVYDKPKGTQIWG